MHLIHLFTFCTLAFVYASAMISVGKKQMVHSRPSKPIPEYRFVLELPFQRDDGKMRFKCSLPEPSAQGAQGTSIQESFADKFIKVNENQPSDKRTVFENVLHEYKKEAAPLLEGMPHAFASDLFSDLTEVHSFFMSSFDFFKELRKKSELGELNDEFLATNKIYHDIQVHHDKDKLNLTYPLFFRKSATHFENYFKYSAAAVDEIIIKTKEFTSLNVKLRQDFGKFAKGAYSDFLNNYCNEYNTYNVLKTFSIFDPDETRYETHVDMVFHESKDHFECDYSVDVLVKTVYRRLMAYRKKVLNDLEQFCIQKKKIIFGIKILQIEPEEIKPYVGISFLEALSECVSKRLPGRIASILYGSKSDVYWFSYNVGTVADKLMSLHKHKKLRDQSNFKYNSKTVNIELKQNGVVFIQWQPISNMKILDKALKQIGDHNDESSLKKKLKLNKLKEILASYEMLRALFIRYTLYETWAENCKRKNNFSFR